jgi:hypothetical protein
MAIDSLRLKLAIGLANPPPDVAATAAAAQPDEEELAADQPSAEPERDEPTAGEKGVGKPGRASARKKASKPARGKLKA